jgi:hypothetical protein
MDREERVRDFTVVIGFSSQRFASLGYACTPVTASGPITGIPAVPVPHRLRDQLGIGALK